jgi:hypothetical protein
LILESAVTISPDREENRFSNFLIRISAGAGAEGSRGRYAAPPATDRAVWFVMLPVCARIPTLIQIKIGDS